jgi:23S rRNA (cytosine1962-C5)-methyltransferase
MDPPSYGRGTNGEVWQFENNIYDLVELCKQVLSDNPLFFLINSYTTGISSTVLANILNLTIRKKYKGQVSSGEVGLPMESSELILPCGIYGRWEK